MMFQFPLKSASMYSSNDLLEFYLKTIPCVCVFLKYDHKWRRASKCLRFGSSEKYSSLCTVYAMSGLLHLFKFNLPTIDC